MELLTEAGYIAGSEVELRIVADARSKPDVIATKEEIENPYPTKVVDVRPYLEVRWLSARAAHLSLVKYLSRQLL